jgi:adenylate kinase
MITTDRGEWLYSDCGQCLRTDEHPPRAFRLVLLGAPGVGKGTQAAQIAEQYKTCPLSTGDVFRAAKSAPEGAHTAAMLEALRCMHAGKLVPDETVIDIVRERNHCLNCHYGFMLDGFPRTIEQAKALEDVFKECQITLDAVLNYTLPTEEVVRRLSGRRTCTGCKATFHLDFGPPKEAGICDHCQAPLFQRDDDRPESILVRLQEYNEKTAPLAAYFEAKGLLRNISAEGGPKEVFERTKQVLAEL